MPLSEALRRGDLGERYPEDSVDLVSKEPVRVPLVTLYSYYVRGIVKGQVFFVPPM